jgi:hypothetical protein
VLGGGANGRTATSEEVGMAKGKGKIRHEHQIQERAYQIWEREGRPDGRSVEHWLQAEAEIAAGERELNEELKLEAAGAI